MWHGCEIGLNKSCMSDERGMKKKRISYEKNKYL